MVELTVVGEEVFERAGECFANLSIGKLNL